MRRVTIVLGALAFAPLFAADEEGGGRPVTFGVRAGLPIRSLFLTEKSRSIDYSADAARYTVGPAVEFRLPGRLSMEGDALFQPLAYRSTQSAGGAEERAKTTADLWEFPVLVKYRPFGRRWRPYVDTGPDFRRVSNVNRTSEVTLPSGNTVNRTGRPAELLHRFSAGYVAGGGVEVRTRYFDFSPEFRYTRWSRENFASPAGLFRSRLNESKFLLGFTF